MERTWGRRAVELDATDEISVRRLIEVLGRLGNGAVAVRLYREFADRLDREYDLEPSPETVAAIEAVRVRAGSAADSVPPLVPSSPSASDDGAPPMPVGPEPAVPAEMQPEPHMEKGRPARSTARLARRVPRTSTGLLRLAVGILGVALIGSWAGGLVPLLTSNASDGAVKAVAVLPFRSIGPGDEDHFFADAMHQEILTQLSRVRSLRVIARSSVMDVQVDVEDNRAVAEKLDVEYLIRGALQISGDRIRIWARLIDPINDEQLWASSLETDRSDLFRVQMETARQIAEALETRFPGPESRVASRPTDDPAAYEAYLKGRLHSSRIVNRDDARSAVHHLEVAVQLDPDFAAAWATLSYSKLLLAYAFEESDELAGAEAALRRANLLAPEDVETRLAQAYYDSYASQDYDRALEHIRQILEARPSNAPAKALEGFVQRRKGRWDEAAAAMTAALELDPNSYTTTVVLAEMYMRMRQFGVAEHLLDRAIAIAPGGELAYVEKALLYLNGHGDTTRARTILEAAPVSLSPKNHGLPALTALFRSDASEALRLLLEPVPERSDGRSTDEVLLLGLVNRLLGDEVAATAWADSIRSRLKKEPRAAQVADATGGMLPLAIAGSRSAVAAALSGWNADAVREAERAAALLPLSKDAYAGTEILERLAEVYALTGRTGAAIETLDRLLSVPSRVTPAMLRLHPLYRPLRSDPRFHELLARYSDTEERATQFSALHPSW